MTENNIHTTFKSKSKANLTLPSPAMALFCW